MNSLRLRLNEENIERFLAPHHPGYQNQKMSNSRIPLVGRTRAWRDNFAEEQKYKIERGPSRIKNFLR